MKLSKIEINLPWASSDAYTFEHRDHVCYIVKRKHARYDYYVWSVHPDPLVKNAVISTARTRRDAVEEALQAIERRIKS